MRSSRWDDETTDGPEISAEDHAVAEAARRRRDIGEAVRGVRLARRMPVRRLAVATGIPERVIDDLEAGRPVDVGVAVLVAEAVGLDVVATMSRVTPLQESARCRPAGLRGRPPSVPAGLARPLGSSIIPRGGPDNGRHFGDDVGAVRHRAGGGRMGCREHAAARGEHRAASRRHPACARSIPPHRNRACGDIRRNQGCDIRALGPNDFNNRAWAEALLKWRFLLGGSLRGLAGGLFGDPPGLGGSDLAQRVLEARDGVAAVDDGAGVHPDGSSGRCPQCRRWPCGPPRSTCG